MPKSATRSSGHTEASFLPFMIDRPPIDYISTCIHRDTFKSLDLELQRDYARNWHLPDADTLSSEAIFTILCTKNEWIPALKTHIWERTSNGLNVFKSLSPELFPGPSDEYRLGKEVNQGDEDVDSDGEALNGFEDRCGQEDAECQYLEPRNHALKADGDEVDALDIEEISLGRLLSLANTLQKRHDALKREIEESNRECREATLTVIKLRLKLAQEKKLSNYFKSAVLKICGKAIAEQIEAGVRLAMTEGALPKEDEPYSWDQFGPSDGESESQGAHDDEVSLDTGANTQESPLERSVDHLAEESTQDSTRPGESLQRRDCSEGPSDISYVDSRPQFSTLYTPDRPPLKRRREDLTSLLPSGHESKRLRVEEPQSEESDTEYGIPWHAYIVDDEGDDRDASYSPSEWKETDSDCSFDDGVSDDGPLTPPEDMVLTDYSDDDEEESEPTISQPQPSGECNSESGQSRVKQASRTTSCLQKPRTLKRDYLRLGSDGEFEDYRTSTDYLERMKMDAAENYRQQGYNDETFKGAFKAEESLFEFEDHPYWEVMD